MVSTRGSKKNANIDYLADDYNMLSDTIDDIDRHLQDSDADDSEPESPVAKKRKTNAGAAAVDDEPVGKKRMGRPPKAVKSAGWVPTADELANPASPGNLLLHIRAVNTAAGRQVLSEMTATQLKNALKTSDYPNDIRAFAKHPDYARHFIKLKSASANTRKTITKAVVTAIDPVTKFAPMAVLTDAEREAWNDENNRASSKVIKHNAQNNSVSLGLELHEVRTALNNWTAMLPESKRFSKKVVLLRLYTSFWPLRDDCKGVMLVQSQEQATDDKVNYLIAPSFDEHDDRPWSFWLRWGKTTGVGRKYPAMLREIPTSLTTNTKDNFGGADAITFNYCLREFIRNEYRNSEKQDPKPFPYGSYPFDQTSLSKYLKDAAIEAGILSKHDANGFLNTNRKWWDNYARQMDEGLPEDKQYYLARITSLLMHTAEVAASSYMRENAVSCGCPENPMLPRNLKKKANEEREERVTDALEGAITGLAHLQPPKE